MKTTALAKALGLTVFHEGDAREVTTGYCGDLLSFVMGRAPAGCAWITVMTNVNVAAVAVLCDVGCVILAQGAHPDENLLERVKRENIALFGTDDDVYTAAVRLGKTIS